VVKTIDQRIEALKTVTEINSEVEAMLRFDEKLLEMIERLARDPASGLPRAKNPHHRQ
jgi:plasmid stabilization system protein ParE